MKRPLIISVLLLCSVSAFAVTAKNTPTVVSQPDGSTFTLVGFGDERYSYAETPAGYVVIQGEDLYWYYAELDAAGRYRPGSLRVASKELAQESAALMTIPKHLRESPAAVAERVQLSDIERSVTPEALLARMPQRILGKASVMNVLILCVQFSDIPATQTAVSFQEMVNDDSYNAGIGGMSKYYKEVSYGAMSVNADYREWVTAAEPSSYYANNNTSGATHVREMIAAAVDAAEAAGTDFSQYDNDGDGTVDGLFVVHAGPGAEEGTRRQYIWSHSSSLGSAYDRYYDGMTINPYIIMPEIYSSQHVEIGVFCHEYGHMLGLPDLYDTDDATNGSSQGVGNWCLMAGGSWGGNGHSPERPAHMSAYCKALLGFTVPELVETSGPLTIPLAETNAFAYKIWLDDSKADEYMLIENRQKAGFDLNLPGSGLLIYHVDKNLADIWKGSNAINVTNTHLGVKVYEADGLEQLATNVNRGSAGDPFPGSTGNTALTGSTTPSTHLWNGNPSGLELTDISSSADVMTATLAAPPLSGDAVQFYRQYRGTSLGYSTSSTGYAMVRVVPPLSGFLTGIRVFSYANRYTDVSAQVFESFNGSVISSPTGPTVTVTSDPVTNFLKLDLNPSVPVSEGIPVYVRIYFQRPSGGYVVPVDAAAPFTGDSYYSDDGINFVALDTYDVCTRVVFRSTGLPVQLLGFTGRPAGKGVTLEWTTASEVNNFGFEVQKDTLRSAQSFTTIAGSFIAGNGTTLAAHTYTFTDQHATPGTWMYRLKQIDLDGTIALSEPVIVEYTTTGIRADGDMPAAIALNQNYPNPFNPATAIPYALPEAMHVRLSVYDLLGREVGVLVNEKMDAGYHSVTFDAAGLPSGAYFVRMTAGAFVRTVRVMLVR